MKVQSKKNLASQRDAGPITRGSLHYVSLCLVKGCFLARVSYLLTESVKVTIEKVSAVLVETAERTVGIEETKCKSFASLFKSCRVQGQRPWSLAAASETSLKIPRQEVNSRDTLYI